jgi:hypothetical protein
MQRSTLSSLIGVALLAGLAACSSDSGLSSSGPTDAEITQGLASDAGESIALTLEEMGASDTFVGAGDVTAGTGVSARIVGATAATQTCGGPDANGWYNCATVTDAGLSLTRAVRFWEGTSYGLWFDAQTDSVNHRWTASGTIDSPSKPGKVWTIERGDTATMAIDRAASPVTHTWNGVGERRESSKYTVNGVERDYLHTAFDTATAVTFAMPRSSHPYPLSGTITRSATVHFTAGSFTRDLDRRIVVTFDGTQTATLQVGALTCDLDLATRAVTNCH